MPKWLEVTLDTDRRSTFLAPEDVPRFLDDALGVFHLVADRRGWTPPGRA